jgi:adenosylcobinamide-GDP ribazoletransferase
VRPLRHLVVALGFLTRLPLPQVRADRTDFAAAIRFYPLAGLVIGALVAAAAWAGAHLDPWTAALAALVAWIAVTGALHLDGLADVADGLGAAHGDPGKIVRAMADPHLGSFGATAIGLQLLAKLVLLHAALPHPAALALVPAAARMGPLAWSLLPPLKAGLGADVAAAVRRRDLIGWAAVLAGAAALVPALLATPLLVAALALWMYRKLGGVSGDAHGLGIELTETGLLLALACQG